MRAYPHGTAGCPQKYQRTQINFPRLVRISVPDNKVLTTKTATSVYFTRTNPETNEYVILIESKFSVADIIANVR